MNAGLPEMNGRRQRVEGRRICAARRPPRPDQSALFNLRMVNSIVSPGSTRQASIFVM
jgi:hypothetical protein